MLRMWAASSTPTDDPGIGMLVPGVKIAPFFSFWTKYEYAKFIDTDSAKSIDTPVLMMCS